MTFSPVSATFWPCPPTAGFRLEVLRPALSAPTDAASVCFGLFTLSGFALFGQLKYAIFWVKYKGEKLRVAEHLQRVGVLAPVLVDLDPQLKVGVPVEEFLDLPPRRFSDSF